MEGQDHQGGTNPSRPRSPNYPSLSLPDAISRVREIWRQNNRAPADRSSVARMLGYSGVSGTSGTVIATISRYGLLDTNARGEYRVSPTAQDILLHRRGDREYAEAIERAAFLPTLFSEFKSEYGARPPSDHVLNVRLQKRGFNDKAAETIIRAYKDTLNFLAAESEGQSLEPGDYIREEQPPQPIRPTRPQADVQEVRPSDAPVELTPARDDSESLSWRISPQCRVRLVFQGHVTQRAIDKLIRLLEETKDDYPDDGTEKA